MNAPFNLNAVMGQFRAFRQNPMAFLTQRKLNIPHNLMNDPNGAIQYLLNSGRMSQDQYNQLRQMAQQIQSDPQFAPFLGGQK